MKLTKQFGIYIQINSSALFDVLQETKPYSAIIILYSSITDGAHLQKTY